MKKANIVIKPSLEVAVCNDIKFSLLKELLLDVAPLYPTFNSWINFTFRRNLPSGERQILIAHDSNQIIGTALLKKTQQESKICTFYVVPSHRNQTVGDQLMDLALSTLDSSDTLITVPDERNERLSPFLISKGFSLSHSISNLYRKESTEHFYRL